MHMALSKTCRSKYTNTFKKIKINQQDEKLFSIPSCCIKFKDLQGNALKT